MRWRHDAGRGLVLPERELVPPGVCEMLAATQLSGFGGGGADIVRSGLQFHIDAGDIGCIATGSTQNVNDLTSNALNLFRGTTSGVDATDPTINGTPGGKSSSEYLSFNGSQQCTAQAAYSGSILRIMGRKAVSFSLEIWMQWPNTNSQCWFQNGAANGAAAFQLGQDSASQKLKIFVCGTSFTALSTGTVSASAWHQIGIEGAMDGSTGTFYIDGAASGTFTINNTTWTAGDSALTATLGLGAGNMVSIGNTARLAIARAYNVLLGAAGWAQNFRVQRQRFAI